MLFTECIRSVEFTWLVFLVSIFVSPGIFCDSSDGKMMVYLIGPSLLLLNPALLWPMHGFSTPPFMELACSFSAFMFGSKFFPCHEALGV